MYINGKWYSDTEVQAYVDELKGKINRQDRFIKCVRSYYRFSDAISWNGFFEKEYKKLFKDERRKKNEP